MTTSAGTQSKHQFSIRGQLSLAVNATIVVLVSLFLVVEYRLQLGERIAEKQNALREEAKTLLPAISQLRRQGPVSVQMYIDRVCGRMQEQTSPGHHIAVQLGNITLQATAHHRSSPEMLHLMQTASMAPTGRARSGGMELVAGRAEDADLVVYVSESLEHVRAAMRSGARRHLLGVTVLATAVALIINLVLSRVVTRPVRRLVKIVRQIGAGQLDTEGARFGSTELDYLSREIASMGHALAEADRNRTIQMDKARAIQENLLPQLVDVSGLQVASLFQPAEEVGGDFYDVLTSASGRILVFVADVTGHGVPAAMSAAMLKSFFADAAHATDTPHEVLARINDRLIEVSLPGDFASALVACIDLDREVITYANAGHEPAWLINSSAELQTLPSTGLILGIQPSASWQTETNAWRRGDRLLVVTDGVTETMRADSDSMFGRERLRQLMRDHRESTVDQTLVVLEHSLAEYRSGVPPHDDVTAILIEATGT